MKILENKSDVDERDVKDWNQHVNVDKVLLIFTICLFWVKKAK